MSTMATNIIIGDANTELAKLPAKHFRTIVTSPPYWGLRDYGVDGQLGQERTPEEYIANMVAVFAEAWRVLADDGTLWLNLGDSYSCAGAGTYGKHESSGSNVGRVARKSGRPKNLLGIPWRVALALQAWGWYLRQEIIWHKPNAMPSSVTDRCTTAHEHIFLLTKSARYYFDHEAIKEPVAESSLVRLSQDIESQAGSTRQQAKTNGPMKAVGGSGNLRNKRSVWSIPTKGFKEAHFATFPEKLVEPCILAGSAVGDHVLDMFGGAGTAPVVADRLGRHSTIIELNPAYAEIARARIDKAAALLAKKTKAEPEPEPLLF
jgi:DNA modification methylase